MSKKDTNPKDVLGISKAPMSTLSGLVIAEMGVAMFEGARKYGRHNYREAGVQATVYFDAVMRHMWAWFEGQDVDPDSGLNHITKALASLMVLRDGMLNGNWKDDRPPKTIDRQWLDDLNQKTKNIIAKYPNAVKPFTELKLP